MKTSTSMILLFAGAATLALSSCGSKKSQTQADYQYQQWLAQQQYQQYPQQQGNAYGYPQTQTQQALPAQAAVPSMVKEEQPECVTMTFEQTPNLRVYGEGSGFYDDACDRLALQNALEKMSQLVEVKMRTATENYNRIARENLDAHQAQKLDQLTRSLSENTARNTRIIKREVFRLSNGQMRVYLCIECNMNKDGMAAQAVNAMSRDGLLRLDADKERFRDTYRDILNDFGVQAAGDPIEAN